MMYEYTPKELLEQICCSIGMTLAGNEPHGCGVRLEGNGNKTNGYFWYLAYEDRFAVSKCDFVFCQDVYIESQAGAPYISLRLDYARHLPPGMMLAYMEEKSGRTRTLMKRGTRVAYTEVMYLPSFYQKHLEAGFTSLPANPVEILKNMGGEHNWPPEMVTILTDIFKSSLTGMSAELYFIAKAYELMAGLITMGNKRLPKKSSDYEQILRVIQYIEHNYTSNIKQSELTRLFSMSGTKLKTLFHQFTGDTITGYITRKKADRAAHMLAESDDSIEQIAKTLGFDTATGFATSFKKQIGISPSEYRKRIIFNCLKNPSEIDNLTFD